MISIREALEQGRSILRSREIPYSEAELLLAKVLGCERMELCCRSCQNLNEAQVNCYHSLLERRKNHEPLSYITGYRPFYRSILKVSPQTFIPRPETELLVEKAVAYLKLRNDSDLKVLEIGTGTGAISISIAKELKQIRIDATDLSIAALQVARENALQHCCDQQISFFHGDLFAALPALKAYDLVISNPPYIPSERIPQLSPEVLAEPLISLDGGDQGLELIQRIIQSSLSWMKKKALLLLEIDGKEQIPYITAMMIKHRFQSVFQETDLSGLPRMMGGYKL